MAHVDHGKSTLADRLLEITGVIKPGAQQAQVLDQLQVCIYNILLMIFYKCKQIFSSNRFSTSL